MVLTRSKTLTIVLLVKALSINLCDSELMHHSFIADTNKDVDHLLRGSGEERSLELEDAVNIPIKLKNDEEINENPLDSEFTTKTEETTTDLPETPEALGLTSEGNIPIDDKDNIMAIIDRIDKDEDLLTSVIPVEVTEATDRMVLDNNTVNRRKDSVQDALYNTNATTIETFSWTEPSSTVSTTGSVGELDPIVPRLVSLQEEEVQGSRSLKENPDQNSEDKWRYEAKPPEPTLSKTATLKNWLEDSWLRPPAAILVPLRPMALTRALGVWNDLTAEGLSLNDIVIVGYDSNGVNWRSRHNLQPSATGSGDRAVAEALSKLLNKYQAVNAEATSDGTMRALQSASKLVPYDSALFVVTDKGAGDPQRLPLALRALVEKRLRVYTIWTDPTHPSVESEQALQDLRNISTHTEGGVLPYALQVMDMDSAGNLASETDLNQWDPLDGLQGRTGKMSQVEEELYDIILVRRGGGEAISLGIPVESGVTSLRVYIEGAVEHAVLYPPNDAPQVDIYNSSSVHAFSAASKTEGMSPRDVTLVFPGAEPLEGDALTVLPMESTQVTPAAMVGVWHLSVRCNSCDYRLCVGARSRIHFNAIVQAKEKLKLRVAGPVASVRESLLVDEYGTELAKLPFSYQPAAGEGQPPTDTSITELESEVALPVVKGSKVYAKVLGRDLKGEPFVRLSGPISQQEVRTGRSAAMTFAEVEDLQMVEEENSRAYNARLQYNDSNIIPNNRATSQVVNQRGSLLTTVQIGLSTRLYGAPGDTLQLHFEVTNYRDQSVRFSFAAIGELRFLRGISPTSQWITAGQTVNVIVTVGITATAQPGARDFVTFTATGLDQVSISTYVYVTNPGIAQTDVWPPEVRHSFQGNCIGRQGDDCAQHVWSTTIIARDALGGLLRLTSTPVGLAYDSNFISGTREDVMATYRATCCAPRLMVTAIDANGNANSHLIDISNYISGAGIAAIVLGVFLFIALIALIVFLIYWCVKRRRESRELPSYATSSRNIS